MMVLYTTFNRMSRSPIVFPFYCIWIVKNSMLRRGSGPFRYRILSKSLIMTKSNRAFLRNRTHIHNIAGQHFGTAVKQRGTDARFERADN